MRKPMALSRSKQIILNSLDENQILSKLTSLLPDVWIASNRHKPLLHIQCVLPRVSVFFPRLHVPIIWERPAQRCQYVWSGESKERERRGRWEAQKSVVRTSHIVRANRATAWMWKPKCCATASQGSASPLFKGRGETRDSKPKLTVQALFLSQTRENNLKNS